MSVRCISRDKLITWWQLSLSHALGVAMLQAMSDSAHWPASLSRSCRETHTRHTLARSHANLLPALICRTLPSSINSPPIGDVCWFSSPLSVYSLPSALPPLAPFNLLPLWTRAISFPHRNEHTRRTVHRMRDREKPQTLWSKRVSRAKIR